MREKRNGRKKRERKKRVVVYERKEKRKKKERERGKKWRYSIFSFCISRGTGLRHLAFLGPLQFSQAVVQSFVMYNPEERERKKNECRITHESTTMSLDYGLFLLPPRAPMPLQSDLPSRVRLKWLVSSVVGRSRRSEGAVTTACSRAPFTRNR